MTQHATSYIQTSGDIFEYEGGADSEVFEKEAEPTAGSADADSITVAADSSSAARDRGSALAPNGTEC